MHTSDIIVIINLILMGEAYANGLQQTVCTDERAGTFNIPHPERKYFIAEYAAEITRRKKRHDGRNSDFM